MPNFTNRFPEGNGSGYVNAGLPNITGNVAGGRGYGTTKNGVFVNSSITGNGYVGYGGTSGYEYAYNFNASSSNSIYGASTTVQPSTCKCYFYIKY